MESQLPSSLLVYVMSTETQFPHQYDRRAVSTSQGSWKALELCFETWQLIP